MLIYHLLLAMFILLYAISKVHMEKYKKFTEAASEPLAGKGAALKQWVRVPVMRGWGPGRKSPGRL